MKSVSIFVILVTAIGAAGCVKSDRADSRTMPFPGESKSKNGSYIDEMNYLGSMPLCSDLVLEQKVKELEDKQELLSNRLQRFGPKVCIDRVGETSAESKNQGYDEIGVNANLKAADDFILVDYENLDFKLRLTDVTATESEIQTVSQALFGNRVSTRVKPGMSLQPKFILIGDYPMIGVSWFEYNATGSLLGSFGPEMVSEFRALEKLNRDRRLTVNLVIPIYGRIEDSRINPIVRDYQKWKGMIVVPIRNGEIADFSKAKRLSMAQFLEDYWSRIKPLQVTDKEEWESYVDYWIELVALHRQEINLQEYLTRPEFKSAVDYAEAKWKRTSVNGVGDFFLTIFLSAAVPGHPARKVMDLFDDISPLVAYEGDGLYPPTEVYGIVVEYIQSRRSEQNKRFQYDLAKELDEPVYRKGQNRGWLRAAWILSDAKYDEPTTRLAVDIIKWCRENGADLPDQDVTKLVISGELTIDVFKLVKKTFAWVRKFSKNSAALSVIELVLIKHRSVDDLERLRSLVERLDSAFKVEYPVELAVDLLFEKKFNDDKVALWIDSWIWLLAHNEEPYERISYWIEVGSFDFKHFNLLKDRYEFAVRNKCGNPFVIAEAEAINEIDHTEDYADICLPEPRE